MQAKLETQFLLAGEEISNRLEVGDDATDGPATRENAKSFWRDTSREQKKIFAYAAVGVLTIFLCQSIPKPFLARVLLWKGGKKVYAAAIILSTYLSGSLASMICGKYQSRIPTKTFVWIGQLILGISQGCFGFLTYSNNAYVFLSLGVLVKIIQGIGQGFFNVAILTLLWHEMPDHIAECFGMTRVMTGLGFLIGPLLGGYLFSIHNEILIPFTVSAIVPLVVSVIGWLVLPNVGKAEESPNFQVWTYIFSPKSIVPLGLASTMGVVFAIYDASFTTYAQTMGVSVATVGTMFSVAEIFTVLSIFLCGYFGKDNHICRKFFIVFCFVGVFGMNFSFIDRQTPILLYVEVSIFAMLAAAVQTLAFPEMIHQSVGEDKSIGNDLSFRSKLSGVWYFVITLSMFVFGVVGTWVQYLLSYSMSLTFFTLVGLLLTFVSSASMCLYRYTREE